VDKHSARSTFSRATWPKFAQKMKGAIAGRDRRSIDEFLGTFDILLNLPVVYH
jgi:hypothetical protein